MEEGIRYDIMILVIDRGSLSQYGNWKGAVVWDESYVKARVESYKDKGFMPM